MHARRRRALLPQMRAMRSCAACGGACRPQYPLVLRFLMSTPALLAKHHDDIADVLRVIDDEKIMPPVSVVQVLSRNGVASIGLVKEWLMVRFQSAQQEVDKVSFFGRPLASWVLPSIHYRTNSSLPRSIGQRPRRKWARFRSSRTGTTRVSCMSLRAQHVKAGWTCPLCTSCATTEMQVNDARMLALSSHSLSSWFEKCGLRSQGSGDRLQLVSGEQTPST